MVQKQEFLPANDTGGCSQPAYRSKAGTFCAGGGTQALGKRRKPIAGGRKKVGAASFLEQLNDPLIYVLLAAALISVLLGEYSDAGIIAFVVCLNAAVGVLQEGKAQRALDSLKQLMQPRAVVIRDGSERKFRRQSLLWVIWSACRRGRWFPRICGLWRRRIYSSRRRADGGKSSGAKTDGEPFRKTGRQDPAGGPEQYDVFIDDGERRARDGDGLCGGFADPDWKNRGADARKPGGDDAAAKKAGRAWKILKPGLPWNLHRVVFAGDCAEASGVRYASDGDFPCGGSCPGGIAGGGHFVSGTERDADGKDQYDHPSSAERGNIGRGFCRLLG